MHKILVPLDGSDHSFKALHIACDLADKYKAQIILLYVLDPDKPAAEILDLAIARKFVPQLRAQLEKAADTPVKPVAESALDDVGKTILKNASVRTRRLDIDTRVLAIATGDTVENILIAQKLYSASTIVMGSRGGNFSTLSSFGSVSHAVFARADCTCISVK